ncbi:23S rRNA (adenine(2503)-C(2))-methyltransferase RlmN [Eubacteriaceae bacterium ES3]|nr:23S rRNA (adenine(2503)-C(2))-methyltransferase RlmN [Eubacteriaceae bacterium ES3]
MKKKNIFGMNEKSLCEMMTSLGQKSFRGKQLFNWLYEKRVGSFEEMTNISNELQNQLLEHFSIEHGTVIKMQEDSEDFSRKYLIQFSDQEMIESVFMRYEHGNSLCVSSQVGCRMGCKFCASTTDGCVRNLEPGEMLDQIFLVEEELNERISNIVIMGMGEPLDNYENVVKFIEVVNKGFGIGQRKITLSTCGLIPQIEALAAEHLAINLAISLHSVFQKKREQIMPIAKKYILPDLLKSCDDYFNLTGRRITYEYALIEGFNDQESDLEEIIRIFKGRPHHLNLIGLNEVEGLPYKNSLSGKQFFKRLQSSGINVTMRRKLGSEIDAACGQLRKKNRDKVII